MVLSCQPQGDIHRLKYHRARVKKFLLRLNNKTLFISNWILVYLGHASFILPENKEYTQFQNLWS